MEQIFKTVEEGEDFFNKIIEFYNFRVNNFLDKKKEFRFYRRQDNSWVYERDRRATYQRVWRGFHHDCT